VTVGEEGNGD